MKKITLVSTLVVALGTLAACTNNNAYGEVCEQALDAFPTLINYSTGKEVFVKEEGKIKALDYTMYLGLDKLSWIVNDKELNFELTWEAAPADKWAVTDYNKNGETRKQFRPLYGEEAFDCSLKATINCVNEKGKSIGHADRTWEFTAGTHQAPDLSEYEYISIEELSTKRATGQTYPTKIYTYGYAVAMHPDIYSGVYIQDGKFGLQLYAGDTSKIWDSSGFLAGTLSSVGSKVLVAGGLSEYNGLLEIAPKVIEWANDAKDERAAAVRQPEWNVFDANKPYNADNGEIAQATLVELKGLTYVSGNIEANVDEQTGTETISTSTSVNIKFKQGETNIDLFANYHIGAEAMTAIYNLVKTFTANQTIINVKGVASKYNSVNCIPVFGVEGIEVVTL